MSVMEGNIAGAAAAGRERVLGGEYRALFGRQWAPWVGGILLGVINVLMFAYAKPWGVAEGVQNWGNWILAGAGVELGTLAMPWQYTTSVTNLSLILGAAIAAMLSRQFAIRLTSGRDLLRAVIGGLLMGIGSALAIGCTIGGFFTAFAALSLAGPVMMAGLMAGAWLGLRLLVWDLGRERAAAPPPGTGALAGETAWYRIQPWVGAALATLVVALLLFDDGAFSYGYISGSRSILVLFGVALGVVNQRSRFCFVRAFREPYMTGDGTMTKAAAMALAVGVLGFAIIKGTDLSDYRSVDEAVNASVWLGSLLGGLVFGIGMVLAGGCASGSLWRAGEGQLKYLVALAMFAVGNASLALYFRVSSMREALGDEYYFLPRLWSWPTAVFALLGVAAVWYLLAAWNEKSGRLVSS